MNCRTHFQDGQVRFVERLVEVQKRRRSRELGRRMIRVGVMGLLEVVEREVQGPNSVEQRRGLSELRLRFFVRGEEDGENGGVEEEEEPRGSEPTSRESPNGTHLISANTHRQESFIGRDRSDNELGDLPINRFGWKS